jgi:hypothetical protein
MTKKTLYERVTQKEREKENKTPKQRERKRDK